MARNKVTRKQLSEMAKRGLVAGVQSPPDPPPPPPGEWPYVQFDLPPSSNNLFMNVRGRGRIKTPEYRAWIAAHTETAGKLKPPAKYPVRVCYRLCGNVHRSRDGYNVEKACTDLLVSVGVLEKDSLMRVTGGRWDYQPSDAPPCVLVWLEEIE